ncbi:hypothetical protein [Reyranella soli]|jgi:hypothetical protein|uniref:Uncharacterized protein n=1 Tax=Reyranella soli TaxID=1230389 RepID=A0A512N6S2_9HYPH|nr:hypothetical protein [Reyranella soli]GEP54687.1 hypothetical protein RSO01_18530 [Reyranella soli]
MARKNVSAHTDEQFALFIDQIGTMLDDEKEAQFESVVRRLVRVAACEAKDDGCDATDHDTVDDLHHSPEPPKRPYPLASGAGAAGTLPARPDFEAIEKAARQSGASSASLMGLIGQLVFSWSNNESMLIYILKVLLQTDEPAAATVFSTLNTTRARLDLVSRLGRIKLADRETRMALDHVVRCFNEINAVRNEFLHAMYAVDAKGRITHTQTMRLINKSGRLTFGQQHAIDRERIEGLVRTCNELRVLNRKVWDLLPQLAKAVESAASVSSAAAPIGTRPNGN